MSTFSNLGPDASIGDILFSNPERFMPILSFANGVMRGDGELDTSTRELIAAFVSGLNDCEFCHGVHEATAQRFGVEPSVLEELLNSISKADVANDLKPVLEFARKLTLFPAKITDEDRQALLDEGFTEHVVKDVIAIVSLFSFFNRLVDGHGVKGNSGIFERDSEMLVNFGYAPPSD